LSNFKVNATLGMMRLQPSIPGSLQTKASKIHLHYPESMFEKKLKKMLAAPGNKAASNIIEHPSSI
jgi:hypothetical protein